MFLLELKDSKELGTRCEIKNVNSIKFMQMAIDYEANRQVDLIEEGKINWSRNKIIWY